MSFSSADKARLDGGAVLLGQQAHAVGPEVARHRLAGRHHLDVGELRVLLLDARLGLVRGQAFSSVA